MRFLVYLLLVLLFSSCSQDSLVPCSAGQLGSVCREYRYYNDQPQGFVQFHHLGDTVLISEVFNTQSAIEKTIREQFINGKTIVITEQFPSSNSRVQSWHYNEFDSLSMIVYGANDSAIEISYLDGKRFQVSRVIADATVGYSQYRYYQDDGKLYRISEYDATDSLLNYRDFDYFSGNGSKFYRVSYYTPEHELIGRRRFSFSQSGLINSMEYRLADGTVAESKNYIYDGAGKLIEKFGRLNGVTSKSVYLYY